MILHHLPYDLTEEDRNIIQLYSYQVLHMFKFSNDITIHDAFIPLIPRNKRNITRSTGLRSIIDWDTAIAFINFQYPRIVL